MKNNASNSDFRLSLEEMDDILKSVMQEFKASHPIYSEYKKPESPYLLNDKLLEMITELNADFSVHLEKDVLILLNRIDSYPNMSTYQLSLSLKSLADCYLEHGITGNALELYKLGLQKNKNLPVKRNIAKLEKINKNDLIYSLDINTTGNCPKVQTTTSVGSALCADEYDPEFEAYIEEQLNELGPSYRKAFYQFVRETEFVGGFNTYCGDELIWSYKDWAMKTIESFKNSKKFHEGKNGKEQL